VANADGSDARVITQGLSAALSPDGRWLTYRRAADSQHVFLRDLENGKTRDLGLVWTLAWSPDSDKLAISNGKELLLRDPDGEESRELARGKIWSVSFSPDGKAIVFTNGNIPSEAREHWSDLFVARLSEDRVVRLTKDGLSTDPVWGRSWIAFSRWRPIDDFGGYEQVHDLHLMRPDGSDVHRLTIDEESAGHGKDDDFLRFGLVPEGFSADGKRLLACVSMELGACEPVTFDVPNGPGRKLVSAAEPGAVWRAVLSADGSQVLLSDGRLDGEQDHSVFTMPFEGGKRRLLLRNSTDASWAFSVPPSTQTGGAYSENADR
jgi:Tol biopolymer transport system component